MKPAAPRLAMIALAALAGLLGPQPLQAQYEQTFQLRDGFGHHVQLRRPEAKTPLITYDVLVNKDGEYFWSGPLTISVDNQSDEVVLQQAADCGMVIVAFAGARAEPAGAWALDYRQTGASLVIGLRADNYPPGNVTYRFSLDLRGGEPAPGAKGADRCESEPWRWRDFSWQSNFAEPGEREFELTGREGFTVRFRRRPDA